MHYITGEDRKQGQIFNSLDDLIHKQHYIRLIDLLSEHFVSDNRTLFMQKGSSELGRKAFHPTVLLNIFIYGYFNGIASSRKLEKECHRNLEMMWLAQKLCPDHKTISDFRKEHSESIRCIVRKFNDLLKNNGYIKGQILSIDGTKVKAYAGMSIDMKGIENKLEDIEGQMEQYLDKLQTIDQNEEENEQLEAQKQELNHQVEELQKQIEELSKQKDIMQSTGINKLSPTDTDARIMKARNGRFFAYNVQTVVDTAHHFIVHTEATSSQNDKGQLQPMVEKAEEILETTPQEVLSDAGYYLWEQLAYLENIRNINCYVAVNGNQYVQSGTENNFTYDGENNHYICPENQLLLPKYGIIKNKRRKTEAQLYVAKDCLGCKRKTECTTAENRSVYRHSDQIQRDGYIQKMNSEMGKEKMRQRKATVEHPFATIKYLMGQIPLLLRGKTKVQTEINLYTLAYNFKRLLNLASFDKIVEMISGNKWEIKPV